jgi:hypothetical protein
VPDLTGAARTRAWSEARTALETARDALLAAVAALDPARLDERLPPTASDEQDSDAALGVRHTLHGMLVGLAEHNAYHGGQLVLLRRAIDG